MWTGAGRWTEADGGHRCGAAPGACEVRASAASSPPYHESFIIGGGAGLEAVGLGRSHAEVVRPVHRARELGVHRSAPLPLQPEVAAAAARDAEATTPC